MILLFSFFLQDKLNVLQKKLERLTRLSEGTSLVFSHLLSFHVENECPCCIDLRIVFHFWGFKVLLARLVIFFVPVL